MIRKGEPAEWMIVYLEGEIHVRPADSTLDSYVYIARAGDPATEVSGRLPFSRMKEWGGTAHAAEPTRVLLFHVSLFPELLQRMPLLAERLVGLRATACGSFQRQPAARQTDGFGETLRRHRARTQQPAAAGASRGGRSSRRARDLRARRLRLCRQPSTRHTRAFGPDFEERAIERQKEEVTLSSLAQSDMEQIISWLDARDIPASGNLSPALVEAGIDTNALESLSGEVGADAHRRHAGAHRRATYDGECRHRH